MISSDDLVDAISTLQRSDLEVWIRDELITPQWDAGLLHFSEMECARVRLICTLHYELEIDVDTLPMILSLLDQIYDARHRLFSLTAAVARQDQNVQAAILAAMDANDRPSNSDNP
jgi:chaperone modulatory protein CbpM